MQQWIQQQAEELAWDRFTSLHPKTGWRGRFEWGPLCTCYYYQSYLEDNLILPEHFAARVSNVFAQGDNGLLLIPLDPAGQWYYLTVSPWYPIPLLGGVYLIPVDPATLPPWK
jgi:hypothetical protein